MDSVDAAHEAPSRLALQSGLGRVSARLPAWCTPVRPVACEALVADASCRYVRCPWGGRTVRAPPGHRARTDYDFGISFLCAGLLEEYRHVERAGLLSGMIISALG